MRRVASRSGLALLIAFGALGARALAEGPSGYRQVQLGNDLPTVIKQTGTSPSQTKVVFTKPALIQELTWRPRSVGPASKSEAVRDVTFSFYRGTLSRIVVHYDRYETEGMTSDDMIDAISAAYGPAVKFVARGRSAGGVTDGFNDQEDLLARWEDPQHRFELIRLAYGSGYQLTGVLKNLEAEIQAATLDAQRLEELEAPQREAARIASEQDAAKSKIEKIRLANKAKFRP